MSTAPPSNTSARKPQALASSSQAASTGSAPKARRKAARASGELPKSNAQGSSGTRLHRRDRKLAEDKEAP